MKLRRNSRLSAVFSPRASLAALALLLLAANPAHAQVSITTFDSPVTENFDAMASSATATLPAGFKGPAAAADNNNNWATGATATLSAFGTTGTGTVTGTSSGAAINWGNGVTASATDRAFGFLNSGGVTSPKSITYAFTNNTGATITGLDIAFDYEKYRSGSRAWTWTFFHGSDSAPVTAATDGDHAYAADAANTTIFNPPESVTKAVSLTDLSIEDGATYYLRWTLTGTGGSSNGQGLGIDNFSITARGAPGEPKLVISQVYSGGGSTNPEASFKQDFIELFNAGSAPANLSGLRLQYGSATGTGNWNLGTPALPNVDLQPGQYYLIASGTVSTGGADFPLTPDHTVNLNLAAGSGKLGLFDIDTAVSGACPDADRVDAVGWGTANCFEGAAAAPTLSISLAAFRADGGCTDTDNSAADFSTGTPTPRNSSSPFNICGGGPEPTLPIVSFSADTISVLEGDVTPAALVFTVNFAPAIASGEEISFDVSYSGDTARYTCGGSPCATTTVTLDDSDQSPYLIEVQTVPDTLTNGNATVTITLDNFTGTDATQPDPISKSGTIIDDDIAYIAINAIQGSGQASPMVGNIVTTRGIVTGVTSNGRSYYLQSLPGDEDADAATSEGLYIFGTAASPAATGLAVGDFVYVTGTVVEYSPATGSLPITELSFTTTTKISSDNPLPAPVVLTLADLDPAGDVGALERYEFMRVTVPRFVVTAPSGAGYNYEFFGVLEGIDRPFRESGVNLFRCGVDPAIPGSVALPPEAPANVPCWDHNPELLRVNTTLLAGGVLIPVRTGTVLENLTGVLDYAFQRYSILTRADEAPVIDTSNAAVGTPVALPSDTEVTIGTFNVENLACTLSGGVCNSPGSVTYNRKATKIARTIVEYLHTPDILGLIEVGNPETLQDISARVSAIAANDPEYQHVMVATSGTQRLGFLIKKALVGGQPRVQVVGVPQEYGADERVLCPDGESLTIGLLNDRAPLVMDVLIQGSNGEAWPVTVINNHLKSMIGLESTEDAGASYACFNDPDNPGGGEGRRNRAKRQQNAEYLAMLVDTLQTAQPDRAIVLVGDFNAFEFNDGLADLLGTIKGQPSADDETVVAGDGVDLVEPDLVLLTELIPPEQRYSYTFEGNAQTIDHALVSQAVIAATVDIRAEFARVNSDFHQGDAANDANVFANSDHDPVVAFLDIAAFRSADLSLATTPAVSEAHVGDELTYAFELSNAGPDDAALVRVELSLPAGVLFLVLNAPAGWVCDTPDVGTHGSIVCTIDVLAADTDSEFSITATAGAESAGTTAVATLSVSSGSVDPTPVADATYTTVITELSADIFSDGFED